MRIPFPLFVVGAVCLFTTFASSANAAQEKELKEWTVLIFLNGNNNLDSYGALNINQMETIGSTDTTNLVVQWASYASDKTRRLLVTKDNDTSTVTSPIVQELPRVDMGDYKQLIEFVKWGVEHYPARHYFIDVWNHGGGWHRGKQTRDISLDEYTGHMITTPQLGEAMREAAKVMGHKVDVYGSDACLMAMAEVAYEMADSVKLFIGSEETEPGAGWPYDRWLKRWVSRAGVTAPEVGRSLVEEYVKSFQTGDDIRDVTLSALDLEKMDGLTAALAELGSRLGKLNAADSQKVVDAILKSQRFAYDDYVDIDDFANEAAKLGLPTLDAGVLGAIHVGVAQAVASNSTTTKFAKAKGVSVWLPSYKGTYDLYADRYVKLKFAATGWGEMLKSILSH